jgi:cytochrome P450
MLKSVRSWLSGKGASAQPAQRGSEGATRDDFGIMVTGKDLVMQVYLNAEDNYSVQGYAERTRKCYGEIYLALDKGSEYDRQSTIPNRAVGSVSREDAFALTLDIARRAVAACPHPGAFEVAHLDGILNHILADLCTVWFGLPDGAAMVAGGIRPTGITPPAHCPGDFALPSGFIFIPKPDAVTTSAGQASGHLLKETVTRFIAAHRAAGTLPTANISRAIFEALPNEDQLIGRTIIGVMMGFLPTTYFNLVHAVSEWWPSGTFKTLQQRLKENNEPAFPRARSVLEQPLMQAMQRKPMPDAVWRTAVKKHKLGPVDVNPGDKIYVNIAKATLADQQAGNTDVFPIFGGNRGAHPHPQHACPGYAMAMGVMLGTLNGLMEPTAGSP